VPEEQRGEPTGQSTGQRPLPDQVTMGLLAYLTANAVDADYAEVAARERRGAPVTTSRRRIGTAGAVVLAIFAVLAVTAAVQTSRDSVSQERERQALIKQVKAQKAALDADRRTVNQLRAQVDSLEAELVGNTRDSSGILDQLNLLQLRSGISPVRGPGVELVVDDAENAESDRNRVLDIDLQKIVNGLWRAGAEAISINGKRLTVLSAIRHAAEGITVNFQSVRPPYRILAVGDPNTLPARFADSSSGQAWLDLVQQYGLRFSIRTQTSLRLPAAELPTLRYAEPPQTTQGKRSS
jgi:uncharacterized protein YlxW (UPF0749 family)